MGLRTLNPLDMISRGFVARNSIIVNPSVNRITLEAHGSGLPCITPVAAEVNGIHLV
jgi:hypothetical protein